MEKDRDWVHHEVGPRRVVVTLDFDEVLVARVEAVQFLAVVGTHEVVTLGYDEEGGEEALGDEGYWV